MGSTVRIEDQDKERLRRLQEAWARTHGERLSQKEILGRGLSFLEGHQDTFLREATWQPLTKEEFRAHVDQARDLGDWSIEDIDDIVYDPRSSEA